MKKANLNNLIQNINKAKFNLKLSDLNEFENESNVSVNYGAYHLLYDAFYNTDINRNLSVSFGKCSEYDLNYKVYDIDNIEVYINTEYQILTDEEYYKIKSEILKNY